MPGEPLDLTTWAQLIGQASGVVTPPFVIYMFTTGRWVRGSEVDKKDALIAAKDEKLDAARDALIEKAIPVLTKAITVMESYQIEERARRP